MHTNGIELHPLPAAFFARDTVTVARELLGKVLVSSVDGVVTGGPIVEVEAYLGSHDMGSHAATKGITKRNSVMYGPPGTAYVYFTYGNHHMLNVVTEAEGVAGAVLVRAIEPRLGAAEMARRRDSGRSGPHLGPADLASGPGKLTAALGVDLSLNGTALGSATLSICDAPPPEASVVSSGRVGLTGGHELELRFFLEGNQYVSKGRTGPKPPSARTGKGHA
ncbi:MAG: DNA-3-methyladenine glycosylase [Coriobacteriia bacterium]|nr:DNA-3-methyladenine glycosylase [Coriobacteriia bacterium]